MSADNQQETTLSSIRNFYYSGFCAGEMSCSIIKAFDRSQKSYYYTPDLTVSNKDISLLKEINSVFGKGRGIITKIKGGYNLSFRGKEKVRNILRYFETYPIITGEIAINKLEILRNALKVLDNTKNAIRRSPLQKVAIEGYRSLFKMLKQKGIPIYPSKNCVVSDKVKGNFLAGVIDAEGSIGFKKSGRRSQPYFAFAMKDRKIVELLKDFLKDGNVRKRRDGVYHYETNSKKTLLKIVHIFTNKYPSKHREMKKRMEVLKGRLLNDCTRSRKQISEDTV